MLLDIYSEGREREVSQPAQPTDSGNEQPRGRQEQESFEKLQLPPFHRLWGPLGVLHSREERLSVSLNGCALGSGGGTPEDKAERWLSPWAAGGAGCLVSPPTNLCSRASVFQLGAAPTGVCRRHNHGLRIVGEGEQVGSLQWGGRGRPGPALAPVTTSHGHRLRGSPSFICAAGVGEHVP